MKSDNPDANPVPGQGNELDRGTGADAKKSPIENTPTDKALDDEKMRPPSDRSPLT